MDETKSVSASSPPPSGADSQTAASSEKPPELKTGAGGAPGVLTSGTAGSVFDLEYGTRRMKSYPITDSELTQLATIGIISVVCFSLAAGLLGIAIDIQKDLALAIDVPAAARGFWSAIRTSTFIGSGIFAVFGGFLLLRGHARVTDIKKSTFFGG